MTRLVAKLTLATFAFITSLLLLHVAASVEPLWAFLAAGLGTWVTGGAFALLVWSAARQYMGPHPTPLSMPDLLDPAEADAWADLERMFSGAEMQPPPCSDHEANYLNCGVCAAQRRAFYAAMGGDES